MSKSVIEGTVPCPRCGEKFPATVTVWHDPGCWRTKNGDGWPASTEYEPSYPEQCAACQNPLWDDWVVKTLLKEEA